MKRVFIWFTAVCFTMLLPILTGCNKDDVITGEPEAPAPVISFDVPSGIYEAKVGRQITISPHVSNAGPDAEYYWCDENDGSIISRERILVKTFDTVGDIYLTFRVAASNGTAEEEILVKVLELTPPAITLACPESVTLQVGASMTVAASVSNIDGEDSEVWWELDGKRVSEEMSYRFTAAEVGRYTLSLFASNADGTSKRSVSITVVETLAGMISFPPVSYFNPSTDRHTVIGRSVYLTPDFSRTDGEGFSWSVDGREIPGETGRTFVFTPAAAGVYSVSVGIGSGEERVYASVNVICHADERDHFRPSGPSAAQSVVHEYLPAPGQFINELQTGGFTPDINTHEKACRYALSRLQEGKFVSLGGFGGYIVVGFDHSIQNNGNDYDFSIQGNAFNSNAGSSNEPGIVWVMQDTNGNGLPDDEWYELKGSEWTESSTLRGYEITYYRPGAKSDVPWTDSEGNTGVVKYLPAFHKQDSYFPAWISDAKLTLRGSRLTTRSVYDEATGNWDNSSYAWGYADNVGSDALGTSVDGEGQWTGFRISNAVFPDGKPVALSHIDFVKVQTGVNMQCGRIGEVSTEVLSFSDL